MWWYDDKKNAHPSIAANNRACRYIWNMSVTYFDNWMDQFACDGSEYVSFTENQASKDIKLFCKM